MSQNKVIPLIVRTIITLCFMLVLTVNSYAVNMQYLRYTPVANFTSEDFKMLEITAHNALNDNKDGEISEWENPQSKNSGSITVLDTSTIDGMHCRQLNIINQSKNQYAKSTFTFCKVGDDWKILK